MQTGRPASPCVWQTSSGAGRDKSSSESAVEDWKRLHKSATSHQHFGSAQDPGRIQGRMLKETLAPLPSDMTSRAKHPKLWASRLPNFETPVRPKRFLAAARPAPWPSPQLGSPTTPRQIFPPKLPQPSLARAHCPPSLQLTAPQLSQLAARPSRPPLWSCHSKQLVHITGEQPCLPAALLPWRALVTAG